MEPKVRPGSLCGDWHSSINSDTISFMKVLIAPNVALRAKTKPIKKINNGLAQTIKDMVKLTKSYTDPEGVGLASTQIGKDEQFFIFKEGGQFITAINPRITWFSKRAKTYLEGCLSIPDHYGEVKRSSTVKVEYQDKTGKVHSRKLIGVSAWIFQHEMDHLSGVLFVDHVVQTKGKLYKVIGKDKAGSDIFQQIQL